MHRPQKAGRVHRDVEEVGLRWVQGAMGAQQQHLMQPWLCPVVPVGPDGGVVLAKIAVGADILDPHHPPEHQASSFISR